MKIPSFPEVHEPSVRTLFGLSDRKLLSLFQGSPGAGLYFVAIYGRYAPMVYALIRHLASNPAQVDYLFALTWRTIFPALQTVNLDEFAEGSTLQSWLLDVTGVCIHQFEIPPAEAIRYSLQQTPPPFWCYLELALEQLPPRQRLLIVLAQTAQWNAVLIASYLKAEGESITEAEIPQCLADAYRQLEGQLPEDIHKIYLQSPHFHSLFHDSEMAAA